ncbi:MAG: outer membrane lipoprotein-sorting protein [Bacteroidetes bacterium]|nr:outer membrane lipoprotein-sorting protein [Bacteroidota bacterium]
MKTTLSLFLLITFPFLSSAQTVTEIVKKADQVVRGKSNRAEMTMKIVKPDWTREFSMKTWALGEEYALIYLTAPVRDKGTVTLKRKSEVWNYLPTINKEIKIPSSMMMQSWMGSDFTNDDLVKESSFVEDYDHDILGDSTVDGRICWKISSVPKPDAAVVWGKIISYISKDGYFQLLAVFYDEDGLAVRKMKNTQIKNAGNRVIPTVMEIIPLDKPGNRTIMTYQSIFFDEPVKPEFFSQQNMKKVK